MARGNRTCRLALPGPPMLVQLPARPLNLDDVAALAAADDLHRYELDEGTLLVLPPAATEHAAIVTRMLVWLVSHGYDAERVLASPGVQIKEQSGGRSPDLAVSLRMSATMRCCSSTCSEKRRRS